MLFTFAGSSHTKYTSYTLETMCQLELESSPELKDGALVNWLVNVEGVPGGFVEGDLHQEHLNLELDESRDHNDADWDGKLMRDVCSRNIHHFLRLKKEWRQGLGLKKKGGKHAEPHTKPEVRKLLEKYRTEELHLFRVGRQYDNADVDDFTRGYNKLEGGTLQKWIHQTTISRGLMEDAEKLSSNMAEDENEDGEADESEDETEVTPGFSYIDDGHLEIVTAETMAEALAERERIEDEQDTEYDAEEDIFDDPEIEFDDE